MSKTIRVIEDAEEDVIRRHHTAAEPDRTADEVEAGDTGVEPDLDEQAANDEITTALIQGLMSLRF